MENYYFLEDLRNYLLTTADELPRFSGQDKVLEFIIEFQYENDDPKQLAIIFCRPCNAMMVGYSLVEGGDEPTAFKITANHSNAWRYDGLNFLSEALPKPKKWLCLGHKFLEAEVSEAGNYAFLEIKRQLSM